MSNLQPKSIFDDIDRAALDNRLKVIEQKMKDMEHHVRGHTETH
jgi:hypothetical protein